MRDSTVSGFWMHTLPSRPSRVTDEDAEDGTELGDEVIAGGPGDQPVPDLAERAEGGGLQAEVVDAPRPASARRPASVFPPPGSRSVPRSGRCG